MEKLSVDYCREVFERHIVSGSKTYCSVSDDEKLENDVAIRVMASAAAAVIADEF